MLLPVLVMATLVVAYAVFAFVSEQNDPLHRPKAPLLRRRWRYGRRLAAGWLAGGALAIAAWRFTELTALGAGVALLLVFGLASLVATISHRRHGRLWEFAEERDGSAVPTLEERPCADADPTLAADHPVRRARRDEVDIDIVV